MYHSPKFLLLLPYLLIFTYSVQAFFEPRCSVTENKNLFPLVSDVFRSLAGCEDRPASQMPHIPPNAEGFPSTFTSEGVHDLIRLCTPPFATSNSAILRMCPPVSGGGHAGIAYNCAEIRRAVLRLAEACQGKQRIGTITEVNGERGYVFVGTA